MADLFDDSIKPISKNTIKIMQIAVMLGLIILFGYFMVVAYPELLACRDCSAMCNQWYSEFAKGEFKGNFTLWQANQ